MTIRNMWLNFFISTSIPHPEDPKPVEANDKDYAENE